MSARFAGSGGRVLCVHGCASFHMPGPAIAIAVDSPDASCRRAGSAPCRSPGPQRIPTEPFEPRTLVGVHPDRGLKVEPVLARLTTAGSRGLVGLNSLAALAHQRTRARHDGREHLGHIQILQRGGRPERDAPARTRKHAVHDQGRHRCVQIQRAPEPLDDSHPSTLLGMALSIVEGPDSRSAGTRETPASAEASAWHAVAIRAKAACSTAAFRSIGMRAPAASG